MIEILAESFNIYQPDVATLKAEAFNDANGMVEYLMKNNQGSLKFQDSGESLKSTIEDFMKVHDKYDIRKIDLLKINSIEILMNL